MQGNADVLIRSKGKNLNAFNKHPSFKINNYTPYPGQTVFQVMGIHAPLQS